MIIKTSWTNANEDYRGERLRIFSDLIKFRWKSLWLKIISIHDHKGDLTITLTEPSGFIGGVNLTQLEEVILISAWKDAFGELNCKIIYDERIVN